MVGDLLLNVPFGILAALLTYHAMKRLPRHERPHQLDIVGAALMIDDAGVDMSGRSMMYLRRYKVSAIAGAIIAIAGVTSLAIWPAMPLWGVLVVLTLVGFGVGTVYPVATVSIQNAVSLRSSLRRPWRRRSTLRRQSGGGSDCPTRRQYGVRDSDAVMDKGRMIARDPDPWIRNELLRHSHSGWPD